MERLFYSRKVWIAIIAFVIDAALLIVGTFFPEWMDFAKQMSVLVSALFAAVIGGIALEDAGAKSAGQGAVEEFALKPSASGDWSSVNTDKDAHSKS